MINTIERTQPYLTFFQKAAEEYEDKCHTAALRKQDDLRREVVNLVRHVNMLGVGGPNISTADFIGDRLILDGIRFFAFEDDIRNHYALAVEFLCIGCGKRDSRVVTEAHEVLPTLRELDEKHVCRPESMG